MKNHNKSMKRLLPEDIYNDHQKIALEIMQPDKGKWPISRTKEGIICIIDMAYRGRIPEVGSTWDCRIKQVHVNKLIIEPLHQLESRASNEYMMSKKLEKLKSQLPQREHKEKVKTTYKYLTKQEIKTNAA